MIQIYGLDRFCFMGYKLDKTNATYHHIIKKENGGKETIENGAILTDIAHKYLHIIEYKDIKTYITINKILKIINNSKEKPTSEELKIISILLSMFEEEHKTDINSKGRKLIRDEYRDRYYL